MQVWRFNADRQITPWWPPGEWFYRGFGRGEPGFIDLHGQLRFQDGLDSPVKLIKVSEYLILECLDCVEKRIGRNMLHEASL